MEIVIEIEIVRLFPFSGFLFWLRWRLVTLSLLCFSPQRRRCSFWWRLWLRWRLWLTWSSWAVVGNKWKCLHFKWSCERKRIVHSKEKGQEDGEEMLWKGKLQFSWVLFFFFSRWLIWGSPPFVFFSSSLPEMILRLMWLRCTFWLRAVRGRLGNNRRNQLGNGRAAYVSFFYTVNVCVEFCLWLGMCIKCTHYLLCMVGINFQILFLARHGFFVFIYCSPTFSLV